MALKLEGIVGDSPKMQVCYDVLAQAKVAGVKLPRLRDYREAAVAQAEREYLKELMTLAKNDLQEACRISDLSQPRLYALLKKHRIRRSKVAPD